MRETLLIQPQVQDLPSSPVEDQGMGFFDGIGFGQDMSFMSMDEMMETATLNLEIAKESSIINIFEGIKSPISDFDLAKRIINDNLDQFNSLQGSIMNRAQALQVACHPHGSQGSGLSISNTSFTEVNLLKTGSSFDEEKEHGHCDSCGADMIKGKCPNC